jgi:hypothetical protein
VPDSEANNVVVVNRPLLRIKDGDGICIDGLAGVVVVNVVENDFAGIVGGGAVSSRYDVVGVVVLIIMRLLLLVVVSTFFCC